MRLNGTGVANLRTGADFFLQLGFQCVTQSWLYAFPEALAFAFTAASHVQSGPMIIRRNHVRGWHVK